ncbi:LysR substrate-binding domain-containing protein [Xanthobacter sp. KR7-225]|uniref:LysR family transcriptional regulator n=1 Tax=Xanthobacter sp. KR7-225 TaxID=3156613 RepID=UPI0032B4B4C9
MKLTHLRDVVAIHEYGSLRAAARHLGIDQPAISRSLRELEQELGAALFERHGRGARPTVIGEAFIRRAVHILNEIRHAREEAEQLKGGIPGTVVAGLSMVAHLHLLPGILDKFRARYGDVELELIEGLFPALQIGLMDGSIDFYFGPPPEYALPSELSSEKLFDNTRIILGRKGHPLGEARSLADLAGARWATTSITVRPEEELRETFAHYGLPPPPLALRARSALSLIVALAYSDLLAMVPVQLSQFPLVSHVLERIPVAETFPAPPIMLVKRAGLPLTPAAEYFVDLAKRVVLHRPKSLQEFSDQFPTRAGTPTM